MNEEIEQDQYVYLELVDSTQNQSKFYELKLSVAQLELSIRYGRIGQQGQSSSQQDNIDQLRKLYEQKLQEKIKKGYVIIEQNQSLISAHSENSQEHELTPKNIKSNFEKIIASLSMHIKKEYKANLALLKDFLESDEYEHDEDGFTELFSDLLEEYESHHFNVDWKDVESIQDFFEHFDAQSSPFLPDDYACSWDELSEDEDEQSIPQVLYYARKQLLVFGLDILVFNDGCDNYRGWVTAVKYVQEALISAENIGVDIRRPDQEWFERNE